MSFESMHLDAVGYAVGKSLVIILVIDKSYGGSALNIRLGKTLTLNAARCFRAGLQTRQGYRFITARAITIGAIFHTLLCQFRLDQTIFDDRSVGNEDALIVHFIHPAESSRIVL